MGKRWINADPAKLQLNSFLWPSGIACCRLGSQNVPWECCGGSYAEKHKVRGYDSIPISRKHSLVLYNLTWHKTGGDLLSHGVQTTEPIAKSMIYACMPGIAAVQWGSYDGTRLEALHQRDLLLHMRDHFGSRRWVSAMVSFVSALCKYAEPQLFCCPASDKVPPLVSRETS